MLVRRAFHALACAGLLGVLCQPSGATVAGVEAPQLTGHVQYETFGYTDDETSGSRWENFFSLQVRGRGRLRPDLFYEFEGQAVADDAEFTAGGYSLRNASRRRPYLNLVTGAITYWAFDSLRITVGKQIVSWSIIDELEPADIINPRDESDVFRRQTLGVPAVSSRFESGNAFAELTVVPLAFNPSRLPQGRWNIIRGGAAERQDLPPVRVEETQAALRVGARLGELEASLFGYAGRDTEAIFVPNLIYVGGDEIFRLEIIDRYPHLHAGGLNGSYPVGEHLLFRLEAVYFNSPDRDRDDFLHSVGGFELSFGDWRFLLSYFRDDQTLRAQQEVTDKGERRFFQSFLSGEVRFEGDDRLRARLRGGYDLTEDFLILQPELSYRVWRSLRVALTADVIQAYRFSYFDSIRHEDRVGTRIEYDF